MGIIEQAAEATVMKSIQVLMIVLLPCSRNRKKNPQPRDIQIHASSIPRKRLLRSKSAWKSDLTDEQLIVIVCSATQAENVSVQVFHFRQSLPVLVPKDPCYILWYDKISNRYQVNIQNNLTTINYMTTIKIKLINAVLTHDTSTFYKMDPYCILALGSKLYRSRTQSKAGKNVTWNQEFTLQDDLSCFNILKVSVMNENVLSDDLVGEGSVDLSRWRDQQGQQQIIVGLSFMGSSAGRVQLIIKSQADFRNSKYSESTIELFESFRNFVNYDKDKLGPAHQTPRLQPNPINIKLVTSQIIEKQQQEKKIKGEGSEESTELNDGWITSNNNGWGNLGNNNYVPQQMQKGQGQNRTNLASPFDLLQQHNFERISNALTSNQNDRMPAFANKQTYNQGYFPNPFGNNPNN